MRLLADAKIAKPLCFGPMNHVIMRTDDVLQTRLTDKSGCIQANGARAKDLSDPIPVSTMGYAILAVSLGQQEIGLIRDKLRGERGRKSR